MRYLQQKLIFTLPYATIRFFYSLLFCLNKLLVTKGGGHFDRKIKGVSPHKTEKKNHPIFLCQNICASQNYCLLCIIFIEVKISSHFIIYDREIKYLRWIRVING